MLGLAPAITPKKTQLVLPRHFLHEFNDGTLATVFPQFNLNPETASSVGTFFIYASDESCGYLPGGMHCRFDYDYQKNKISRCWQSDPACRVVPLAISLSEMRKGFAQGHADDLRAAKKALKNRQSVLSVLGGQTIPYYELSPGPTIYDDSIEYEAGLFFVHRNICWTVFDLHCSNFTCNCNVDLFIFRSGEYSMTVENHRTKPYVIRKIDGNLFSRADGMDLMQSWLKHKPIWFRTKEMVARTNQTRRVAKSQGSFFRGFGH